MSDYYGIKKEEVMRVGMAMGVGGGEGIRWKILGDLMWVIDGNIEFCRS